MPIVDVAAEGVIEEKIIYNTFSDVDYDWKSLQGEINRSVKNGVLSLSNKGDSIMFNEDDQVRNNGDVALKFKYNNSMNCVGFVIRGNNSNVPYQNVSYNFSNGNLLLGNTGNWISKESLPRVNFVVGQSYNFVARYEGDNLEFYVNGQEIFNGVVDGGAGPINGSLQGKTGVRMYCGDQSVDVESFVSGPLNSIPNDGFPEIGTDLTYYNFDEKVDTFKNIAGTFNQSYTDETLTLLNNTQEAIVYDTADKVRSSGDIEMDFKYSSGLSCFGPTFRSDGGDTPWQVVSYAAGATGSPYWSIGHPSGYWSEDYPVKKALEAGKDYKLVVRYKDSSVQIYVNGELELDVETVTTGKGNINPNDSAGKVGFRKHCLQQGITIDRLISADYGVIPNGGMTHIDVIKSAKEEPEIPVEPGVNDPYFAAMRKLWKEHKVGDFTESDLSDPEIVNHINNVVEDATVLKNSLKDKSNWNDQGIWEKLPSDTISANITTQFSKLNKLSRAYSTKSNENPFYGDEEVLTIIKDGLDFLTKTKWYDGVNVTGNWWDFQVGIPQELVDILINVYDVLPQEDVLKYAKIVNNYIPNPEKQIGSYGQGSYGPIKFGVTTSGANRTDLALTYLATGMLLKDENIVKNVAPSIKGVIDIKRSGDGFYADGSYIQHGDIPYTGSYGNIAVKGVGKILSYLEGTPWQMGDEDIQTFSKLVYDTFIPVIYKGETMPMVGGRSISRAPGSRKEGFGSATIFNLLIVSNFASEPYKNQLKEAAKYWILEDETDYYFNNNRDLRDLLEVKSVLKDSSISGTEVPFKGGKVFYGMDRFVHSSQNYSFGLSMYSKRISAFEAGNKENKKGWFTSDGMMYIQNQDKMFGESYWPTVDWYRLPGTTVDTRPLKDEETGFAKSKSPQSYVGGTSDGDNSAVGMVLNKAGMKNNGAVIGYDLKAFKSWFVNDDVIYALGAGINGASKDNGSIETIVENRLLDPKMNYTLKSNIDFSNTSTLEVSAGDWFMLEAQDSKNNISYVFLDDHKIRVEKEENTGKYSDINGAFVNDKTYTESYQKIIIEHGSSVTDGKYAYAVLPGITQEELNTYLASDVEVLSNTADVQSVRVEGVTLGTVYPDAGGSVNGLSVVGAPTFIMDETDTEIVISVADPKQADSKFNFTLDRDNLIQETGVSTLSTGIKFTVDNTGLRGGTTHVRFKKLADKEAFNEHVKRFNEIDSESLTEYSRTTYSIIESEVDELQKLDNPTQAEVDSLSEKIKEFIINADFKLDFDYVLITLEHIGALIEADYTSASWQAMKLNEAEISELVDRYDETEKLEMTQDSINTLLRKLQDSVNNLELKIDEAIPNKNDLSVLRIQIELFDMLNLDDYSNVDVVESLTKLIEKARLIDEDTAIEQLEIDELVNDINKLLEQLEVKQVDPEEGKPVDPEENKPVNPEEDKPGEVKPVGPEEGKPGLPNSGVTSDSTFLLLGFVLVVSGIGIMRYRKRKEGQ